MKWTNKKCRDAVIAAPLHFAIYSYVLCKELVINTEYRDKQNYCRQYICKIRFHPVVHLESLAGVCLCLEIAPAPAVSCNTEKQVYKRAKRQEYIAYKEILNVKNCASEDFKAAPTPDIVSQYARQ